MESKSILITGCSTGIGRHCALWLSRKGGWKVLAAARKADDVSELAKMGLDSLQMDVGNPASVEQGFNEAVERAGGRLDAVFGNAGFGIIGALEDTGLEPMEELFRTNVFGLHDLNRRAIRVMREQGGGRIILNSSVLGFVCMRHRGAYCATKHAVEALAATLRLELAGTGIHVVSLQPGPISSRFRDNAMRMHQKHIDADSSRHREEYRAITENWRSGRRSPNEQIFTLGPEAVYKTLVKALHAPKPKAQYRITVPTKMFWWLKRALPTKVLDAVIARV